MSSTTTSKRVEMDLMKLMMADYKVELINDSMQKLYVELHGPKESLYEGGVWRVMVELRVDYYPYLPPWIVFVDRIYHPNISVKNGSVCLDVLYNNSPMFDLLNVFEAFLPQLLLYPNPDDPLNKAAGSLMRCDRSAYEQKVKEYCEKYVKPANAGDALDKEPSREELVVEDEYASSDEDLY